MRLSLRVRFGLVLVLRAAGRNAVGPRLLAPQAANKAEIGCGQQGEHAPKGIGTDAGQQVGSQRRAERLRDEPRPCQAANQTGVVFRAEQRERNRAAGDRVDAVPGAVEDERQPDHRQVRRQQNQAEGDEREGGGQRPERMVTPAARFRSRCSARNTTPV
jgi:hypothetical protein